MCISRSLALTCSLFLASTTLLSACKSETYETGAAAGKSVQQAADEVRAGIGALDSTVKSLNVLLEKPAPDPAPQFKVFSTSLDNLESQAKSVRDLAAELEKGSKAYFAKWDEQIAAISNEDIKERTQERRKKVEEAFASLRKHYEEAREEFKPLLADLKDVRTALGADLTPPGIDAVRKTAGKITKASENVKESLTELANGYRELGVGLGKAGTPAPEPAKK